VTEDDVELVPELPHVVTVLTVRLSTVFVTVTVCVTVPASDVTSVVGSEGVTVAVLDDKVY